MLFAQDENFFKMESFAMFSPRLIILSLLVAGTVAAAQPEQYSATVGQALSEEKTFVANGNVWRCAGSTCLLKSAAKDADAVRTCHELKRQTGPLTAYGSTAHPFDEAKLSKCNGGS
jgi:hypothetical protein